MNLSNADRKIFESAPSACKSAKVIAILALLMMILLTAGALFVIHQRKQMYLELKVVAASIQKNYLNLVPVGKRAQATITLETSNRKLRRAYETGIVIYGGFFLSFFFFVFAVMLFRYSRLYLVLANIQQSLEQCEEKKIE